ncbi:RHS repeat protein, partial [Candidatus Pacearchaeota archaeon]|nr:RHS repeat protein [Candidatus Pacearchaeota archaeon]
MQKTNILKTTSVFTFIFFTLSCVMPYTAMAFHVTNWYGSGTVVSGSTSTTGTPVDREKQNPSPNNPGVAADPVYVSSGEFYYKYDDMTIPGRGMDVKIKHIYHSGKPNNGSFGYGWSMNYCQRIRPLDNGNVAYQNEKGLILEYTFNGTDYTAPDGYFDELIQNGNGTWTLTDSHGRKRHFDINGNLTSMVDRNGNTITFEYDAIGFAPIVGLSLYQADSLSPVVVKYDYLLTRITDTLGRQINLDYDASGHLMSITDFNSRTVTFNYDTTTYDLLSITTPATAQYPGGATTTFTYDSAH